MRKVRYWGSIEPFRGQNGGSVEPFGVRWNLCSGLMEPFGGFDRTFLGWSPISGYCSKTPSNGEHPGDPNHQDLPQSIAIRMEGVLLEWPSLQIVVVKECNFGVVQYV